MSGGSQTNSPCTGCNRDYSGTAPAHMDTLMHCLQGEAGLMEGTSLTDARLAFVTGQVRAVMAAAAAATSASAGQGAENGPHPSSASGGRAPSPGAYLTAPGASSAVIPLMSDIWAMLREDSHDCLVGSGQQQHRGEDAGYDEDDSRRSGGGADSGGMAAAAAAVQQKHSWWVRAQMAVAAADLFALDAAAMTRDEMGGVNEALIQVGLFGPTGLFNNQRGASLPLSDWKDDFIRTLNSHLIHT